MRRLYSSLMVKIFEFDEKDVVRTSDQEGILGQDNTMGYSQWNEQGIWED